MEYFDHEQLNVYQSAVDFLAYSDELAGNLPKGRAYLAAQLRRASSSIVLNIAEGAGEFSKIEKARFYRIARRSATESAGILDCCTRLKLMDSTVYKLGRDLLLRIVSMLVQLARSQKEKRGQKS